MLLNTANPVWVAVANAYYGMAAVHIQILYALTIPYIAAQGAVYGNIIERIYIKKFHNGGGIAARAAVMEYFLNDNWLVGGSIAWGQFFVFRNNWPLAASRFALAGQTAGSYFARPGHWLPSANYQ